MKMYIIVTDVQVGATNQEVFVCRNHAEEEATKIRNLGVEAVIQELEVADPLELE